MSRAPAQAAPHSTEEQKHQAGKDFLTVTIHYLDAHLKQTSFEALILRNTRFRDLAAVVRSKLDEGKAPADRGNAPVDLHYFAVDSRQTVRELSLDGSITELKDYLINGQLTVHCLESTAEEIDFRVRPTHGARIIWIRRYAPVDAVHWRPAGVPFTCLVKDGESVVDFRSRLQTRLGFDAEKMQSIELAVLTQQGQKPITKETDQPWALIAADLHGVWTCLGMHDPAAPRPQSNWSSASKPAAPVPRSRPLSEVEQIHLAALDEEDRLAIQALFEQDRVQAAAAAQARQQHRRPPRARADSESEGEDEDDEAAEEAPAARSKAALEARLAAIVDSDAGQDHSKLSDDAACHVCMERPKRTLTVCCAVVGVCTSCMKRLLLLQCAGSSSAKCPNCNVAVFKGKPFGIDAVVFNVKT